MSELKILRNNYGLEIWKGTDDKFPFCRNDMNELKNCIEKVLSKDVDEYEFKREEYGSFRLARDGSNFRLYGNLGYHYPCTESELKRLLKNVQKFISPSSKKQNGLTLKDLSHTDILIIANPDDKKAAIKIKNKIYIKFRLSAIICDNLKWEEWNKKESEFLIDKPQISIGGPEYNKTTKKIEKYINPNTLLSTSDYEIKIGEKDIVIYGKGTANLTDKATDIFLSSKILDYYIYCYRQYSEHKKEQPVTTQNPKKKKSAKSKKKIKTIRDYSILSFEIDKYNHAIPEVKLVKKVDTTKFVKIKFNKRSDRQFSLLLFLILESMEKESDWLNAPFSNLKDSEYFAKVCKLCSIPEDNRDKSGWWDDPTNERKKGYVLEINKKINKLGIQGEFVVLNPKYDGVYNLLKSIKPAKLKDI